MGKIDQLDYAVDHGITQGYQGVDTASGKPAQEKLKEVFEVHRSVSFFNLGKSIEKKDRKSYSLSSLHIFITFNLGDSHEYRALPSFQRSLE